MSRLTVVNACSDANTLSPTPLPAIPNSGNCISTYKVNTFQPGGDQMCKFESDGYVLSWQIS